MAGRTTGIIVAAGSGERMGGVQKAFTPLLGREMVAYPLRAMEDSHDVDHIVLVVASDSVEKAASLVSSLGLCKVSAVCAGGNTRRESVLAGLQAAPDGSENTLVHDGARPCITTDLIARGVAAAREHGAGVPAVPVQDTIKEAGQDGRIAATPDRSRLYAAQTPQAFRTELLKRAHAEAPADLVLDDASLVEALGEPVHLFEGDAGNIKVTTPTDVAVAEAILRQQGNTAPDESEAGS